MNDTSEKLAIIEALIESKKKVKPTNDKEIKRLAEQAIASMRDSVNNNQFVMGEILNQLAKRPKELIVVRDKNNDMIKIVPVYESNYDK